MYNASGELSKEELDQLQHWVPEEGLESSRATHVRKWSLARSRHVGHKSQGVMEYIFLVCRGKLDVDIRKSKN
jgi:hypothetical protein